MIDVLPSLTDYKSEQSLPVLLQQVSLLVIAIDERAKESERCRAECELATR